MERIVYAAGEDKKKQSALIDKLYDDQSRYRDEINTLHSASCFPGVEMQEFEMYRSQTAH